MGNRKMGNGLVLGFLWSDGKMSLVRESPPRSEKQQGIWKVGKSIAIPTATLKTDILILFLSLERA